MADDFRIEGADAMLQLGKRMKAAGRGDLLKAMNKELKVAPKRVTTASRKNTSRLPTSGGLAQRVAKAPQRVTSRVGNTTASVRVTVAGKKSGAWGANKGKVRHLVFGRPGSWVTQDVEPGWFDDAVESESPEIRDDVVDVLTEYAEKMTRRL